MEETFFLNGPWATGAPTAIKTGGRCVDMSVWLPWLKTSVIRWK